MPEVDIFRSIAELLRSGSAQPLIYPERVAPSAVYDLNYQSQSLLSASISMPNQSHRGTGGYEQHCLNCCNSLLFAPG